MKVRIRRSSFGLYYDVQTDKPMIVVFGNSGQGRVPLRLLLPHQLYVKDVNAALAKGFKEIEVVPIDTEDFQHIKGSVI